MPAIKQHIQTQKGKDTQLLISASKYMVLNAHGSAKKSHYWPLRGKKMPNFAQGTVVVGF